MSYTVQNKNVDMMTTFVNNKKVSKPKTHFPKMIEWFSKGKPNTGNEVPEQKK